MKVTNIYIYIYKLHKKWRKSYTITKHIVVNKTRKFSFVSIISVSDAATNYKQRLRIQPIKSKITFRLYKV